MSCATTTREPASSSKAPAATTKAPAATTEAGATTEATTPKAHGRKEHLLQKAAEIIKAAEAEIKVLTSESKTDAAEVLKKEEALVKRLVAELELVKEEHSHALNLIEHELTQAENRLKEQINKDKAHDTKTTEAASSSAAPSTAKSAATTV